MESIQGSYGLCLIGIIVGVQSLFGVWRMGDGIKRSCGLVHSTGDTNDDYPNHERYVSIAHIKFSPNPIFGLVEVRYAAISKLCLCNIPQI